MIFETLITLSYEDLEIERIKLCKKVTNMTRKGCAIVFLKEWCDLSGANISYRQKNKYLWCFFRPTVDSHILLVARSLNNYYQAKRQVSQLMIEKLKANDWPELGDYNSNFYDPSLKLNICLCNQEYGKRITKSYTSAVLEIAQKNRMSVYWKFNRSWDGWECHCTAVKKNKVFASKKVSLPIFVGSKKAAKELASEQMLSLFLNKLVY